ncbi:MAG: PEP-CTERM sorting domain-containing protein [Opitutaceae bacterium]
MIISAKSSLLPLSICLLGASLNAQSFTSFPSWTQTEDPAHPNFSGSSDASSATLTASNGNIPAGTDIGYASVNGADVASSTGGNYFSAASSFSLAIDYDLSVVLPPSFGLPTTGLFIGFGIGEDIAGSDSAGITIGVANSFAGNIYASAATARANDVTLPVETVSSAASPLGTLFLSYDHVNGDITVGAANAAGAASATDSHVFTDIASSWDGEDLLASFFMRSDDPVVSGITFPEWNGTSASAVFSNLRVLEGDATSAVPEPSAYALMLGLASGMLILKRRRA